MTRRRLLLEVESENSPDCVGCTARAIGEKGKGLAEVQFRNGVTRTVELHWYEATGIGQKEHKIKRFLD